MIENEIQVIEGEKGCFAKGTTISTASGPKNIEDIKVGDKVLGFNTSGDISEGAVTKTFKHDTTETQDNFITINHVYGSFTVTTNHWILLTDNTFVEAGTLSTLNDLCLENGKTSAILSIIPVEREEFSYNFTVEPHHTYIANNVRVHNKGGGKDSGSSRPAVEDPNTLRSRQTARVLNVISEGEIEEVLNTFFDDTPIENFYGAFTDDRTGTSIQPHIAGFSDIEGEFSVDAIIRQDTPPLVRAVSTLGVDAMRVTLQVDALWSQDKSTGDMHGDKVRLRVYSRVEGGTWYVVSDVVFAGKTITPYRRAIRIESPDEGLSLWEVKVERITEDFDVSSRQGGTRWTTYTEIQDVKLTYDNTALVGVISDAEATGGKIPRMSFQVKGMKVRVPNNYDVINRTYDGNWDGTFASTLQYTNNNAWILYDILTHERYGLDLSSDYLDKFSFYQASIYNDSQVENGSGTGDEPLFTFNGVIQQRQEAFKIVQTIAASMRAVLMEVGGVIKLVQDRPTDSSIIITNNDVIDGMFEYRSAGLKAMHTSVNVTFNDPADRFLTRTVTEEDATGISRYGLNTTDVVAFGCTSEGQARRHAKWILDTELNNADNVLFRIGMNKVFMEPGDVISLMDDDYADTKHTGLIKSATINSITFDRELFLENESFSIVVTGADGNTVEEKAIVQTNGYFTTVSTTSDMTTIPNANSSFIIQGNVVPRPFKVVSVLDQEDDTFEVVANFYDPDKYDRVISGIINEVPTYTTIDGYELSPPTNPRIATEGYYLDGVKRQIIRLEWDPPIEDELALTYTVKWSRNNTDWMIVQGVTHPEYSIQSALGGSYEFIISAVNLRGVTSLPLKFTGDITFEPATDEGDEYGDLYPPLNLRLVDGELTFTGKDASFKWDHNTSNDTIEDPIASWRVRFWNADRTVILRTEILDKDVLDYTYTFTQNGDDRGGTPARDIYISVQAVSVWNKVSVSADLDVSNPIATPPTVDVVSSFDSVLIKLTNVSIDADFERYIICKSVDEFFEPSESNKLFEGNDVSYTIPVTAGETIYVRVAAIDGFWDGQYSTLLFSTSKGDGPVTLETTVDLVYSGITFTAQNNTVSWTAGNVSLLEKDQPAQYNTINAGSYNWTSGEIYLYGVWGSSTVYTTTNINTALGDKYHRVLAIYRGSNDLIVSEGGQIIDGGRLISGSVAATQLSSGLLITNKAQIGTGIIENANIKNATIDSLQLKDGSITKSIYADTSKYVRAEIELPTKITDVTQSSAEIVTFTVPSPTGVPTGTIFNALINIGMYVDYHALGVISVAGIMDTDITFSLINSNGERDDFHEGNLVSEKSISVGTSISDMKRFMTMIAIVPVKSSNTYTLSANNFRIQATGTWTGAALFTGKLDNFRAAINILMR